MRISDWSSDVCSSDLAESTTPAPSGLPYPPDYLSQKIDIELFARPPSPNPNPKPNTFSSSQGGGAGRRLDHGRLRGPGDRAHPRPGWQRQGDLRADRKSTRLNSSH